MQPAPLLRVADVEVVYNDVIPALRGVSIVVPEGSVVAILGANGAGKTTLMRAVTGLLGTHRARLTHGVVELAGCNVNGWDAVARVRAGVSQVMEGRRVFAQLTVEENLRAGGFTVRGSRELRRRHDAVLNMFPALAKCVRQPAGHLSGGQQQMLAIGRALMQSPRLLLLDEPSLGLAPLVVEQIRVILADINASGTAIVLIEQNAAMALSVADFGYVLEKGRMVKSGRAADLLADKDIQEYYLGVGEAGRRSYRDVKTAAAAGAAQ